MHELSLTVGAAVGLEGMKRKRSPGLSSLEQTLAELGWGSGLAPPDPLSAKARLLLRRQPHRQKGEPQTLLSILVFAMGLNAALFI